MRKTGNLLWGAFAAGWILCGTRCMAFEPVDATVKDMGINIRSEAGMDGAVISSAAAGSKLQVCDAVIGQDGQTWYVVYVDGATRGYIRGDLVTTSSPIPKPSKTAQESAAGTSGQDGTTGTSGQDGEQAQQGTATAAAQPSSASDTGSQPVNGKAAVTGSGARIRSFSSTGSDVVALADAGTLLTLLQKTIGTDGETWYQVSFVQDGKSVVGYIRAELVKIANDAASDDAQREAGTATPSAGTTGSGVISSGDVNVRVQPVDGMSIGRVSAGYPVQVTGEVTGSDGNKWYYIRFTYGGVAQEGYVRSDFVTISETEADTEELSDSGDAYAGQLEELGFPKSYQAALAALHTKHPNWSFQAAPIELGWNDAVLAESRVGNNLVPKNSIASLKSVESTAYSYADDKWYTFDGGSWVAASREAVAYYMDPRNFLDENGICQFETLEYRDYQTKDGVSALLASTFMKGTFTEPDGTELSYAQTFADIGKQLGVSPYHLAARCCQEQGSGRGEGISGKVSGYTDIFNYFQVGAYAVNGNMPVLQGLAYASGTDGKYQRPWDTRYKSLLGGSMYLAEQYIEKKQNTLYFQKFNVVNSDSGIYSHQYTANLMSAPLEAARMRKAYGAADEVREFIIPVYNDMPERACAKPTSDLSPNNYLASLSVGDQNLSPAFDGGVTEYSVEVPGKVEVVTIEATPVARSSMVRQTGRVSLKKGVNTFTVVCRSASGNSRTYTLHITRK